MFNYRLQGLMTLVSRSMPDPGLNPLPLQLPASATTPADPATPAPSADSDEPPEGYYAFVESPNATPPR